MISNLPTLFTRTQFDTVCLRRFETDSQITCQIGSAAAEPTLAVQKFLHMGGAGGGSETTQGGLSAHRGAHRRSTHHLLRARVIQIHARLEMCIYIPQARIKSAQIVGAFDKWVELRLRMIRAKRAMVGEIPVFF